MFSGAMVMATLMMTSAFMIAVAIGITSPGSEETVATISAIRMVRRLRVRTSPRESPTIPILVAVTMMKTMATAANTATRTPTGRNMRMVIVPATNQRSDDADIESFVTPYQS